MKKTTSQKIALGVLSVDTVATFVVMGLCALSIWRGFEGALPYLTTLIGALQVVTGIVLSAYFKKSAMENCKGGIVYDSVFVEKKKEEESEGDIV
jgi:hypothetical protein